MNIVDKLSLLKRDKSEIQSIAKEFNSKRKDYLDRLNDLQRQIISLEKEYENNVGPLRKKITDMERNVASLGREVVFVKLGDLLKEISSLSGVELDRLKVSMETNVEHAGTCSYLTMFRMLRNSEVGYTITFKLYGISRDGENRVNYITYLSLDKEMQKENNDSLYKYCSLKYFSNDENEETTLVVIDRNIENVILSFNLNQISNGDKFGWSPASLFTDAVVNCVSKYDKKRIRKK